MLQDIHHEKTIAILRLIEIGIPAKHFEACINFLISDTTEKQVNVIELLLNVGVAPEDIIYAVEILDLGF